MTQQLDQARISFDPTGRDRPSMTLPADLAAAVLAEVWKASPERFGNFVKKGMIRLWGPGAASSVNGDGRHE
jgi:hypothetical protein